MIIYVAGPMTGIEDLNYPEFNRVASILRSYAGVTVINPADNPEPPPELPKADIWEYFMAISREQVRSATHVALLSKWSSSKGAREEVALALSLGLYIYDWHDLSHELAFNLGGTDDK